MVSSACINARTSSERRALSRPSGGLQQVAGSAAGAGAGAGALFVEAAAFTVLELEYCR
jgi:hypothetical protein